MTKIKTDMKSINNGFRKVFRAGYCELQYIFRYQEPQFYNSGIYGWNCDIYIDYQRDIAITTGYRNMRGKSIPSELIEKYSIIAKTILADKNYYNYKEIKKLLDDNREKFLDELEKIY